MSEPVVFIIRFKIKEGKAAEFRMHYRESIQRTFETKPVHWLNSLMKMKKPQNLQ